MLRLVFGLSVWIASTAFADSHTKLKLGALLTLSGSFSSAGEDCRRGIEAAVSLSDKSNIIDVIYADSKNQPSTAVSEFRRLVDVNQVNLVYTHRSSIGMPLNPVSQKSKIALLGAAGHKDFATTNKYSFQLWPRSDYEGEFMAKQYMKNSYKKVALIYTEDEWTGAIADGFRRKYSELGGNLVFDQSVLLSTTDFKTLLIKIKKKKPDAVYMNVLLPQIGPLIKQARDLGIGAQYFANFYVSRSDVIASAGKEALEGVRYLELDTNLPTLKRELGMSATETPAGLTVASYVATMLVAQVVSKSTRVYDAESIYSDLVVQKEVRTPDHVYPIKDRVVEFPLIVKVIKDGVGVENPS